MLYFHAISIKDAKKTLRQSMFELWNYVQKKNALENKSARSHHNELEIVNEKSV